jgi:TRAP-type uncharacterized transport system substrate-binding protein
VARCGAIAFCCLAVALPALLLTGGAQAADRLVVAQSLPRRPLPLPNKPVPEDENARAVRLNQWTVGLAGGLLVGTFSKYAQDLATALDDGDNLRVLPINTFGAVGNVVDLVYLKGVDFAITYADVLDYYKNVERIPGIEQRVNYVIPMFQGEFHLLVRPEIKTIEDLAGKKVGFNTRGSAANYTGGIVFDRLGVKAERVFMNNTLALEAMRKGELFGLVHAVGKPNTLFTQSKPEPGFHFLPVAYTEKFKDYYTPAELTNADYPNFIPQGETIQTISVQALLAVYNWRPETDRYRRCVRFVEYLLDRYDRLRVPPYQRGWKQANLAGTIPGWTRFPPAQEILDKRTPTAAGRTVVRTQAEQERLFRQFLEWSRQQSGR